MIEFQKFRFPKDLFRFDDGNFLYSRELLVDKAKTYEITIKNQLYQLAIKEMSDRVTVEDMWQFVRSKTPCKRPQDLIRMLETLLKQTIRSRMVCIRNQFFEKNQTLFDDGEIEREGSNKTFFSFRTISK